MAKLKTKMDIGGQLHLVEQWCYEVDLKSDLCYLLIHIHILLYFIMTIIVVLFYAK